MSNLATNVKILSVYRGMSLRDLATKANLSYASVSTVASGKKTPSGRTLAAIANALQVKESTLLADSTTLLNPTVVTGV